MVVEPALAYGGWFSHDMRTFFRDKFSDPAALADLMEFGGREQAELHGNRGVTKSKDNALGDCTHAEEVKRLQFK